MKALRITVVFLILVGTTNLSSQVFQTATSLKKSKIAFSIDPAFFVPKGSGDSEFAAYFMGGYGLTKGADFRLRLGTGPNEMYLGGDVKYMVHSGKFNTTVSGGVHVWNDFGLDLTLNVDTKISRTSKIYGGLDMDVVFADKTRLPMWFFIGVNVPIGKNISFMFETDMGLTDDAGYHIIHGGIKYYL